MPDWIIIEMRFDMNAYVSIQDTRSTRHIVPYGYSSGGRFDTVVLSILYQIIDKFTIILRDHDKFMILRHVSQDSKKHGASCEGSLKLHK